MSGNIFSWEEAVLWLRNQPDKQELVRACFYDDPPEESAERFYQSTEWKAVQNLLASVACGTVLDIGAGRGISSYAFARDGWIVTALEPDASEVVGTGAILQVAQSGLDITIIGERGEQLPFPDNTFDLVYGRAVLHHAQNLKKLCEEASRVLKRGGLFLFTREHVISSRRDLESFLVSHPLHFLYKGENAYLLKDYVEAIKSADLTITNTMSPLASDINLFPTTKCILVEKIKAQYPIPLPDYFVQKVIIPVREKKNNSPGRLYSFLGHKR